MSWQKNSKNMWQWVRKEIMKLFQKVVRGLLLLVLFFPYATNCIDVDCLRWGWWFGARIVARDYNGSG